MSLPLYLASRSPRRVQLLEQLGLRFQQIAVDVAEQQAMNESPAEYVSRVARDKARAGIAALAQPDNALVLGADTEVVLDGEVFGKPHDAAAAANMLRRLAGRSHQVISTVWLLHGSIERTAGCSSQVRLATIDAPAIDAYVASGEPFGKAGGYAIQGRGAAFIEHLSGSYSAVMGLPLHETAALLHCYGLVP